MKNLEARLQIGSHGQDAVVGGRVRCLPGFSGTSMEKPFPEAVRDLWALVDGPNMLNLSFDSVMAALKQLRKSNKAWLQKSEQGLSKNDLYTFMRSYNTYFNLGSDDRNNALCAQAVIDEVLDSLLTPHARAMSKRTMVELLVSTLPSKIILILNFSPF